MAPPAASGPSLDGDDEPMAETLVRILSHRPTGTSYEGGRFDRRTGAVISVTPNSAAATVQLDGGSGEVLRDVPAKFIAPQRPDRAGELCVVTMGPKKGRSAKIVSVDGSDFMVTLEDKSMHVLPPGALAKKA